MSILRRILIEDYGCIRELSLTFPSGLHAFIGPNDSGKSTILRAVRTAVELAIGDFLPPSVEQGWRPFDPGFSPGRTSTLQIELASGHRYRARVTPGSRELIDEVADAGQGKEFPNLRTVWNERGVLHKAQAPQITFLRECLVGGARLVRLVPDRLRQPSTLVPEGKEHLALDESGFGIAGIYDVLMSRGDGTYQRIADDVRARFPTVRHIQLRNVAANLKQLQVVLTDGTRVPAPYLSEGLLYYLAFAAIPELWSNAIILVEEPENGLHPARIADVVRALRRAAEQTTVLVATHSPLVVNELEPTEVSLVRRPSLETGTEVIPMTQVPNLEDWQEVYALGELWVSFADGKLDQALFTPPPSRAS